MGKIKIKVINWFKEKFVGEKKYIYLVSFFIPIFVLLCTYIAKGTYPFGDNMYLARDMYHQYAPFFSEFYNKLTGGGDLTYSWNIGLGTNFTGLYAYYLASPINWFLALINRKYLIEIMNIIIVMKIALSSVSCTYYLRHHYGSRDLFAVGISSFYALSAYIAAYSWNIMWLDCILLLPLIVLGLEKLEKDNKGYLYCITLGISIISNYYISFMVCIYMVLYFLVLLFSNNTNKDWSYYKTRLINFAVFSLLAGMVAACLIVPEYFALKASASGEMNFPDTISRYFSIFEILSRGLMNLDVSETTAHDPNIYSSIIVYLTLPLYWMGSSKNSKEKVGKTLLVAFFLISFNFNILNYIWHGFHFPNSLPARQSFIFIFLLLTMSYEVLININEYKNKHIYGVFALVLVLFLLYEHLFVDVVFDYDVIYVSILFLALYLLVIQKYRRVSREESDLASQLQSVVVEEIEGAGIQEGTELINEDGIAHEYTKITKEKYYKITDKYDLTTFKKQVVMILFLLVVVAEALVNFGNTGLSVTSRSYYVDDNEHIDDLITTVEETDDSFYRIEKYDRRTKNDAAWHGYKGVSMFSSTSGEGLNNYMGSLGFENSMNAFSFYGQTPLTSSLFSVKYMLDKEEVEADGGDKANPYEDGDLNSLVDQVEGEYLYRNNYTLPLGFMLPADFDIRWDTGFEDPFIVQNNFSSNLGQGHLFYEVATFDNGGTVTLQIENNHDVYIYVPNSNVESLDIRVNDINGIEKSYDTYGDYTREHIINLGSFEAGDYIHINSPENELILNIYAYTFDKQAFINLYHKLNSEPLIIESFEDTLIKGHIKVENQGLLYTSIPFDEGWSVKVDGYNVEPFAFKDALLAIPVAAGDHTVELSYSPQGLKLGVAISILAIICFIIIVLRNKYYYSSR